MKQIVVFGCGKSATALIDYLIIQSLKNDWFLTLADFDESVALAKSGGAKNTRAVGMNISSETERDALISRADIIVSLLPADLHLLVALSCLKFNKNLFTASYYDESIKKLQTEIEKKGLLFLGEMGLDPGIDHMSAMRLIHDIQSGGGIINSFYSHCGGLISPESDNNPWHYKISWSTKNVVNAGKPGATYLKNGEVITEKYENLFDATRKVNIKGLSPLSWYPNRNSLTYIENYSLYGIKNFIRTTLRYPEFNFGWKNIIDLKLTEDAGQYQTNGMSLKGFFTEHFKNHGLSNWLSERLSGNMNTSLQLLKGLSSIINEELKHAEAGLKEEKNIAMVDHEGQLQDLSIEAIKLNAANTVASQMLEANTMLEQLVFLGLNDDETLINKGVCTAAEVLVHILENKLKLLPEDKDMIVMLHQIEFEQNGKKMGVDSSLVIKGENNLKTAMAKTVGLPLGIAVSLLLSGEWDNLKGMHIPVIPEIYNPVLKELEKHGIVFEETIKTNPS